MNKEVIKLSLLPGFRIMFGKNYGNFMSFLDGLVDDICRREAQGLEWQKWCINKMAWRAEHAGIGGQYE